ncbi:MAG: flavodoxin family protein [Candidatus Lokiarchaeota archaeon]|nr:flavodoxin family protein [Candidatus Lokiarchaeota archaeon]
MTHLTRLEYIKIIIIKVFKKVELLLFMKTLIVYFTMGGRTKKTAEAIASALTTHEVSFFPMKLTGKFIEKIKMLDKFENKDFSAIESELNTLDAVGYDLIIFGMPTYGSRPPLAFDEILARMGNLSGKKAVVFNTARFTGGKALDYMKTKVEEAGTQVIDQRKFRKLFWIGVKNAIKFGKQINERKE